MKQVRNGHKQVQERNCSTMPNFLAQTVTAEIENFHFPLKFASKKSHDSRRLIALFFFGFRFGISNIRIWCRESIFWFSDLTSKFHLKVEIFKFFGNFVTASNRQGYTYLVLVSKKSSSFDSGQSRGRTTSFSVFPTKRQPLTTKNDFRASKLSPP